MFNTFGLLSSLYVTFFGALFLLASSNRQYKNRFHLALFFFNGFILFSGHVFSFYEYWEAFHYFDFVFIASLLSFYPLYFRYLNKAFGYRVFSLNWRIHFAPAIGMGLLMLVLSYTCKRDTYREYMQNNLYGTPTENPHAILLSLVYQGARFIHILQILFYNLVSFTYLLKTRKNIQNSFSNPDRFQLRYFYVVNLTFLLFMAIPGIYVTIIGRTPLAESGYLLGVVSFLFTFLFVILAMAGVRQKAFTDLEFHKNEEIHLQSPGALKDHHLSRPDLLNYFEKKSPWQNPNLNIWEVSAALASNRTYVSQLINKEFSCNFNSFVNSYRIERAKDLLLDNKLNGTSMDHISEMAGFGSTSTFVRVFKQHMGITPVKYKEEGRAYGRSKRNGNSGSR